MEIKPGVYWVGAIDLNLRYFHGYLTPRGTTYNAYLIVDDKITLVDTVKHYLFDEMLSRITVLTKGNWMPPGKRVERWVPQFWDNPRKASLKVLA